MEKFVGKKPVQGLYTDEELIVVQKYWAQKADKVRAVYSAIPKTWKEIVGERKLSIILEGFNIRTPSEVREIEDAKQKRIPYLLVTTGRGKNKHTEIAKGSNLVDKLKNIGGGENPRIPGKLLWSPLDRASPNVLIDLSLRLTQSMYSRNRSFERHLELLEKNDPELLKIATSCQSKISQIATIVVELLPDHKGEPAWDTLVS